MLRARLFSEPTFPHIIGQTQCFAAFLTFRAPLSSFFWLFLFPSSILLSDSSHLCFSSLHIVGRLTSKLPLTLYILYLIFIGFARSVGLTNCNLTFCQSPVGCDRCFGMQKVCNNGLKYNLAPRQDTVKHVKYVRVFIQLIAVPMVGPLFKNVPKKSKMDKKR